VVPDTKSDGYRTASAMQTISTTRAWKIKDRGNLILEKRLGGKSGGGMKGTQEGERTGREEKSLERASRELRGQCLELSWPGTVPPSLSGRAWTTGDDTYSCRG